MGWDGNGNYTRVHNFSADSSASIKILASRVDAEFDDVASAFTRVWTRDGQNTPTTDLPMGGRRFVNVGAPTSVSQFMRSREFIENVPIFMQDAESSADRVSVSAQYFTSVSANQAPGDGTRIIVRANSNKSSAVLYLNGHSANIEYQDGNRAAAAMVSGGIYEFLYSSVDTAWKIQNADDGRTAAEIAAGVTPVSLQYTTEPLNAKRYGATGDGTTDDTTAINNWIAVAKQMTAPRMWLPGGTYNISTSAITFDVPDNSVLDFEGSFSSSATGTAVRLGSTSANTNRLRVHGFRIARTSDDSSGSSVGVELRSLVWSSVDIVQCTGFREGVKCNGTSANGGFSYNRVFFGFIHDNRTNVVLTASGSGYCNENNFYGGSFNHSSGYAAVSTVNIQIDHFASSELNNNRFWGPSLEDNAATAVAAVINGNNNVIIWPRMERVASGSTYEIQFTADSAECEVIGHGFSMVNTNINDLGSGNLYNTREGRVFRSSTPNTAGKAVLALRGYNTSTARALLIEDSGGVEVATITGEGNADFSGRMAASMARLDSAATGAASTVTFGISTQTTVGAAGAASALPAQPTGYLRFFVGTTEFVIPYYAQA